MIRSRPNAGSGVENLCSGSPISMAGRVDFFLSRNYYLISLNRGKYPVSDCGRPAFRSFVEKLQRLLAS
jgi:hypothetical protein